MGNPLKAITRVLASIPTTLTAGTVNISPSGKIQVAVPGSPAEFRHLGTAIATQGTFGTVNLTKASNSKAARIGSDVAAAAVDIGGAALLGPTLVASVATISPTTAGLAGTAGFTAASGNPLKALLPLTGAGTSLIGLPQSLDPLIGGGVTDIVSSFYPSANTAGVVPIGTSAGTPGPFNTGSGSALDFWPFGTPTAPTAPAPSSELVPLLVVFLIAALVLYVSGRRT